MVVVQSTFVFALSVAVVVHLSTCVLVKTIRNGCERDNYPFYGCASAYMPDKFCSSNRYCVALRCQSDKFPFDNSTVPPTPITTFTQAPEESEFNTFDWFWHYYVVNAGNPSDKLLCLCNGAIQFRFFEITYADYQNAVAICSRISYSKTIPSVIGTPVPQYIDPANIGKYFLRQDRLGIFKVMGRPGAVDDEFAFYYTKVAGWNGSYDYELRNVLGSAALVTMDQLYAMIAAQVGLPDKCHKPVFIYNPEWSTVGTCTSGANTYEPLSTDKVGTLSILAYKQFGTIKLLTVPASTIPQGGACQDGGTPCSKSLNGIWPVGYCYFGLCTTLAAGSYCTFPDECTSNACNANVCA